MKVLPEISNKYKRTMLNGGEVLLTLVGSTGQSVVVPQALAGWNVARAIAVIKPKPEIGANWINIFLQSSFVRHYLEVRANTTVQKTLNLKDVRSVPIPIPPDYIKQTIESIAMSISDKIAINQQINQTLEAMAQAIFKSWFVDFEPTRAKVAALEAGGSEEDANLAAMMAISGKSFDDLAKLKTADPEVYAELHATASLFPSGFIDSELGEIPEGWKGGKIGDVAKAKGGFAFKSNDFQNVGHPVLKIKNITGDGRVDLSGCQCVSDEVASKAERFELRDGDLVMAMTGATVGKVGFVVNGDERLFLNQRVAKFESEKYGKKINWFLYCCFQRETIFACVLGAVQGSAQPNISSSGIESTSILLPSSEVIIAFCTLLENSFDHWIANIKQSKTLAQLRDSLLPKLLSGEFDVPEGKA